MIGLHPASCYHPLSVAFPTCCQLSYAPERANATLGAGPIRDPEKEEGPCGLSVSRAARAARLWGAAIAFATVATTVLAGAALAQEEKTINVAIVGNPQMEDIASLTPELFTAETGINVEYTILEEQTLREIVTRDVGAGGQQFDVVMIGMFEAPQFGRNGWLVDLNQYAAGDADYAVDDLIPAVRDGLSYDGGLYAAPFYGESSFLMYRKDVLDAAGITMPDAPTWDEVAEIARADRHPRDGGHLPARQARLG